jgi:hypothetical protein
MSNNMMGAAFQYYAQVTGEKVAAAQERVVARGVLPNSRISPGYVRGADGVLVVERPKARIVVQAFRRRDRGASLVEIQPFLANNGIERSISGVESMLRSRMYLGEIRFGELHNLRAHEPIITDRALFERVRRRTVSRGRQAKSERLLARLGVLRCRTCGSRMVINSYTGSYRCGDTSANRYVTSSDGTEIFYKDWGSGQPVVFSHGWPSSADDWDTQMLFFLNTGSRVIAHDRRAARRRAVRQPHGSWTPARPAERPRALSWSAPPSDALVDQPPPAAGGRRAPAAARTRPASRVAPTCS